MGVEDRDNRFERLRQIPFEELRAATPEPERAEPEPAPAPAVELVASAPARNPAVYDAYPRDPPLCLRHPFTLDGIRYDELRFRPPSFEDVDAATRGEISELEMHARMAGVPVAVLRALLWVDCELATFIARSLSPDLRR